MGKKRDSSHLDSSNSVVNEYIPANKKPALGLEPLMSLLAAAKETLTKAAQGPRILDSPIDDFAPKYVRSSSMNLVSSTSGDVALAQGSYNKSQHYSGSEKNYIEVE